MSIGLARLTAMLVSAASLTTHASGRLPDTPLFPQTFASFEQCLAELERRHAEDLKGVDRAPRPLEGGGTIRQSLDSQGVQRLEGQAARYDAEVGWSTRRRNGEWIESNYTWERHDLRCDGNTLTGVNSGGYHLPSQVKADETNTP